MVAEFHKNLNLFKMGTDDNRGVEESIDDNFKLVDDKVGDSLTDKNGKVHATLGTRMNEELTILEETKVNAQLALDRQYNVVRDELKHHTIALRGYTNGIPENTYASFMIAKQMGFWGVKVELRLSSDKQWVVFQDSTIDRTTSGSGILSSKTLAQLKAVDSGAKLGGDFYAGERILTAKEFLWFCRENNMVAYMEIKAPLFATDATELLRIINEYSMLKRCALISVNIPDLKLIRDLDKNIQVGHSTALLNQTNIDYVKVIPNSFIYALWTQLTPANYLLAIKAGLQVDAYSPSNYEDVRTAIMNGARRVTSSTIPY